MTKIVLLADLHGNLPATKAIEKELERIAPDEVYFLGDAVGKGPDSDKTCDWVRTHCKYHIGGNWDFWVGNDEIPDNLFFSGQLGRERLEWLNSLPTELELLISGIRFRLFHGRPVTDLFQGSDSDEKLSSYMVKGEKIYGGMICADSHRPYERITKMGYALNTGSVGNSLGVPRAHALLLEGEKDCRTEAPLYISTISVPYDNKKAAGLAEKCQGLPMKEAYIREVMTGVYAR